jgi:sulfatase modifying factor 1
VARHREFSFLGRARPLRLEDIYVGLRVAEHTPPERVPDASGASPQNPPQPPPLQALGQTGHTLEVPEALSLSRRLLVLGEAGSGKSTLLKYLVLAMARRDPRFGPFARSLLPNRATDSLERVRRALSGANLVWSNLLLALVAMLAWAVAVFLSDARLPTLAGGLVWAVAGSMLFVKYRRRWVRIGSILGAGVLAYAWAGPYPVWPGAAWLTSLSLAGLLYPYWSRVPLALLKALIRCRTGYPLPILLTLNNLAGDGRPLEEHAAAAMAECGLRDGHWLLLRRLRAGRCLLLLDALDEVTDPGARERVIAEINRLRHAYGEGNQILVTSRPAGYRYRLDGLLTLEVQPFQSPQVTAFVRHWFAGVTDPDERARRVDGLLAALAHNPRIRALAASPLLLALIALSFEADWRLPEQRTDLYDEALNLLTERWKALKPKAGPARFASRELLCALGELAREAHEEGLRVIDRDRVVALLASALERCGIRASAEAFLDAAMEDTGLLRRKSRRGYDFVHLTFQEFLAAESLLRQGQEAALLARAGDPWWREVIRLYAGQSPDPAVLLQTLLASDPLLAAGCLADARSPGSEAVARAIVERLNALLIGDPALRQAAADALAEVGDWGARDLLFAILGERDRDPSVALAVLLALAPGDATGLTDAVPGGLGALLRLVHGELPRIETGLRPRVLALLEATGHPLCHVPAGDFRMGNGTGRSNERPRHRVMLSEYWIDRHPVTNRQFAAFARETGFGGTEWRQAFFPGKEDHPVVLISWDDACAYATWCGKRLPTEAEWEKAARGTDGRRYPWENRWDGTRCNVTGRGTTPVGAYPEGVSPYGCQDMVGNVWEWVADWYDATYYARSPGSDPTGPETGVSRVVRGGSWNNNQDNARADNRNDNNGFRLVCASHIHHRRSGYRQVRPITVGRMRWRAGGWRGHVPSARRARRRAHIKTRRRPGASPAAPHPRSPAAWRIHPPRSRPISATIRLTCSYCPSESQRQRCARRRYSRSLFSVASASASASRRR